MNRLSRVICRSVGLPAVMVLACLSTATEAGIIFNLTDTGGAGIGTNARSGFQAAADFWASKFTDNIEVNLDVGFTALGAGILGQANTTTGSVSYSDYRAAVIADASSAQDALFAAGLPGGPSFNPYINRTADNPNGSGSATAYVDADGGANNTSVQMTTATAKALGLLANAFPAVDAAITFSSSFTFDFDPSNGITGGAFDFVGVAIHEIGHALGFISGVDVLDFNSPPLGGTFNDNAFTFVTPLDFTRFSTASQAAGADLDWTADARAKYFSIDGGDTVLLANAWSTGVRQGDGRQASHWKDGLGIGIMDPTLGTGELGIVRPLDLLALDVIGFNSAASVPEPSSALFAGGLLALAAIRRRRR